MRIELAPTDRPRARRTSPIAKHAEPPLRPHGEGAFALGGFRGRRADILMGGILTALAGFVDAVGYIGLGGLYASFMSGASVSLGVGLGGGDWGPVYQGSSMIASFLAGVATATVLAGLCGAWRLPAILFLEGLMLGGAVLLAKTGWAISVSILPVAAAMGAQNTALQPVEGVRLGATFITGTLVSLGKALGKAVLGRPEAPHLIGNATLWAALTTGAGTGALLYGEFGPEVLVIPAALVTGLAVLGAVSIQADRRAGVAAWRSPSTSTVRPDPSSPAEPPFVRPYY